MNTIIFLSGVGCGVFLATLLLWAFVNTVLKKKDKDSDVIIELMRERNELDKMRNQHILEIWKRMT